MPFRIPTRACAFLPLLLFCLLPAGCGSNGIGTLHPVKGRVLRNGKPIEVQSGYVVLKPDAEKGNETKYEPSGTIDSNGNFVIYTEQHKGAPPGWYKVVVTATGPIPKPKKGSSTSRPIAKQVLDGKYGQAKTTPLSIEVVASPSEGAYDLEVSK